MKDVVCWQVKRMVTVGASTVWTEASAEGTASREESSVTAVWLVTRDPIAHFVGQLFPLLIYLLQVQFTVVTLVKDILVEAHVFETI